MGENQEALTPETVAALSRAAGIPIPEERLAAATELLQALFTMQARIDALDLTGYEPAFRWDARWPDEAEASDVR